MFALKATSLPGKCFLERSPVLAISEYSLAQNLVERIVVLISNSVQGCQWAIFEAVRRDPTRFVLRTAVARHELCHLEVMRFSWALQTLFGRPILLHIVSTVCDNTVYVSSLLNIEMSLWHR